ELPDAGAGRVRGRLCRAAERARRQGVRRQYPDQGAAEGAGRSHAGRPGGALGPAADRGTRQSELMRAGAVRAGAHRLETGWWGAPPDAAPTLVLLHEGLGSVGLWRDFPSALVEATDAGVFVWSRQGYGGSDPVALPRPLDY